MTNLDIRLIHLLQTANFDLLVAIAKGEVDARSLALKELVAPGLNPNGKWVGFDQARKGLICDRAAGAPQPTQPLGSPIPPARAACRPRA
jgi:hypothetical protein